MKVVILAGGYGTRISEESQVRPKPLVEIGGRPILWHIMKIYSHYGLNDFVICCGYKGEMLKQYFRDYMLSTGDVTFDLARNAMTVTPREVEPWTVTLVDTGIGSMTGGRLKRVGHLLDDTFCLTYGDGVGDVDIAALIEHHRRGGALSTVTAVSQPGRFGTLALHAGDARVHGFREKGADDGGLVNGGFFVLEPDVLDFIDADSTVWEREPMERLVDAGQLQAFRHSGFWQPMDTLRDKMVLEELWQTGQAPWKVWDRPASPPVASAGLRRAV
jgi:glucose-1-phosphate cytidylyltransferase